MAIYLEGIIRYNRDALPGALVLKPCHARSWEGGAAALRRSVSSVKHRMATTFNTKHQQLKDHPVRKQAAHDACRYLRARCSVKQCRVDNSQADHGKKPWTRISVALVVVLVNQESGSRDPS